RYLTAPGRAADMMQKIQEGTAPDRFTNEHLQKIGFTSSNDRAIIPLLKELKFLTADGTPTQRYHEYRNSARSRKVLGEALREAYEDIFHINAHPTEADQEAVQGLFKSVHNVSDNVAYRQAATFFALLKLADVPEESTQTVPEVAKVVKEPEVQEPEESRATLQRSIDGLQ